jgi:hypothetical protein
VKRLLIDGRFPANTGLPELILILACGILQL